MATCKNNQCGKAIGDKMLFCPNCGCSQQAGCESVKAAETRNCAHCDGKGECRERKTGKDDRHKYSCEYCLEKAETMKYKLFPIVPCRYCEGKGFYPIQINSELKSTEKRNRRY